MSFKTYKKGLKRGEDEAIENSRHIYGTYKIPLITADIRKLIGTTKTIMVGTK